MNIYNIVLHVTTYMVLYFVFCCVYTCSNFVNYIFLFQDFEIFRYPAEKPANTICREVKEETNEVKPEENKENEEMERKPTDDGLENYFLFSKQKGKKVVEPGDKKSSVIAAMYGQQKPKGLFLGALGKK